MRTQVSSSSHKKPVNIGRIIKTPLRAVSKAFDLYVKGITNLTISHNKPPRTYETTTNLEPQRLPRSFSTSRIPYNDYEQPSDSPLVRSISTAPGSSRSTQVNSAELENHMIQQRRNKLQSYAASKGVPRSCSVGMGRIDEDRASSFNNDNLIKSKIGIKEKRSMFSSFRKS